MLPARLSRPGLRSVAAAAALAAAMVCAAGAARATHLNRDASARWMLRCLVRGGGAECNDDTMYDLMDMASSGATSVTTSMQYDPSVYAFDPEESGPLGVFSLGGDAPPAVPGVGTEPLWTLPETGDAPGAPLAGSTLTYSVTGGVLTVDYQFGRSITVGSDTNVFLLAFTLVHPLYIDLAHSTVTYDATGPGADFTQSALDCSPSDASCGSDTPTIGTTFSLDVVPEPGAWALLVSGFAGLGAALRARAARSALERGPSRHSSGTRPERGRGAR